MARRRALVWLGAVAAGLALLVAAGAVAIVLTVDPEDYRDEIAAALERATGRQVTFGGPMSLALSLSPRLVAEDVSIANVREASRPQWAMVRRLEVSVALLPLLSGDLRIRRARIEGGDFLLETDAEGRGNWVVDDGTGDDGADGSGELRIDRFVIEHSTLAWRDGTTGKRYALDIATAILQAPTPGAPLQFDASASYAGVPLTLTGSLDNVAALRAGRDVTLDLAVSAPNLDASATGVLGGDGGPAFDLALSLEVASLGLLKTLGVVDLPLEGPLSAKARLTGGLRAPSLGGLDVKLAGSTLTGDLVLDFAGAVPAAKGTLALDAIDLQVWFPGSGEDSEPDKVFPSDPLPLDLLGLLDADLDLKADRIAGWGLAFTDVAATARLAGGKLAVDPARATLAGGTVEARLSVDAGAPARLALDFVVHGFDAGALLATTGATSAVAGKADLAIHVSGRGNSLAAAVASADGTVALAMADGSVEQAGLDLFLGGATALVGTMFAENAERARLSCLAAAWDVEAGLATQTVLLVDTDYSTLKGEGTIDLRDETIDETVTPVAKGVTLSMAVPVHIGGTLAAPTVAPDQGALALKLGSLIGSVFFPPALLLGLGDVGITGDHPCLAANDSAPVGDGGIVEDAGEAVEGAAGAVGDVIEGIGEGLGDLFGD